MICQVGAASSAGFLHQTGAVHCAVHPPTPLRSKDAQLAPNRVVSEQQSLVVIKKLLAIAVSGITYLRGILPGRAYGKKYVEDQQVMILREVADCPGATQILHWMQGCFEAIQKKYLRKVVMILSVDPENCQNVTEVYQFKIQYHAEGALVDFESNNNSKVSMSCGNTKKASILLVRKLYTLMQNLGPLPESVCLSMKLAYYDDVTPVDYQPPGFKEADGGCMEFELEPLRMTMGKVVTPFHSLKLDMTTERHRVDQVSSGAAADRWILDLGEEEDDAAPILVPEVAKPANTTSDPEKPKLQEVPLESSRTRKTCEEGPQTNVAMETTCDQDLGVSRTRSGRIIKSTRVYGFSVPDSQGSSSRAKRRKLSEPKKRDW